MAGARLLIAAMLIAAAFVAGHPMFNKDDQTKRWRKWYDRVYSTAPLGARTSIAPVVSVEEAQRAMNKLFDILKQSGHRLRNVPEKERDQIAFWLGATSFSDQDCNISREFSFLSHYARDLDTHHLERPYLKAYMTHLKHQLLQYCMSRQNVIIVRAIEMGHSSARDRRMVSSMGTKGDPVEVDYVKLKRFLLFMMEHGDEQSQGSGIRESSMMRTKRLYQSWIRPACDRIKNLPESARDAILYLEHNKVLNRVTSKAREWLRNVRICDLSANNMRKLDQIMKETIIGEGPVGSISSSAIRSSSGASGSNSIMPLYRRSRSVDLQKCVHRTKFW